MSETYHVQVADYQSQSRYPWADGASLRTTSGLVIPREAVEDAVVLLPGATKLIRVVADGEEVSLVFASQGGRNGTAKITAGDRLVEILDDDQLPAGLLMLGESIDTLLNWPTGTHEMRPGQGDLVAAVCLPEVPSGRVTRFRTADGGVHVNSVWLVGERGVNLDVNPDGDITVNVVGEPLFRRLLCQGEPGFESPVFIRTINGQSGDQYRNWQILVGRTLTSRPALRVIATPSQLSLGFAAKCE